jgi:rod shape-determining protein MreC
MSTNFFDSYINQAVTISNIQIQNTELKNTILKLQEENEKLKSTPLFMVNQSNISPVKVLAYSNLPSFSRLWIDYESNKQNKIHGLLWLDKNNELITAGIAVKDNSNNNKLMALLNIDTKCSYSVVIGKTNAPGILMGLNDKNIIVRYIPYWMSIKVGDEVVTSGLDNIFYSGIRVGRVKSITGDSAYKEAIVEQYFTTLNPQNLYIISN